MPASGISTKPASPNIRLSRPADGAATQTGNLPGSAVAAALAPSGRGSTSLTGIGDVAGIAVGSWATGSAGATAAEPTTDSTTRTTPLRPSPITGARGAVDAAATSRRSLSPSPPLLVVVADAVPDWVVLADVLSLLVAVLLVTVLPPEPLPALLLEPSPVDVPFDLSVLLLMLACLPLLPPPSPPFLLPLLSPPLLLPPLPSRPLLLPLLAESPPPCEDALEFADLAPFDLPELELP